MIETITIHNLEVLCRIGIWEWEQGIAQKLQLDLDLGFDFERVIATGKLEDTINYVDVTRRIESLLHDKNFGYLELLVDRVTDLIFETYPAISLQLRVRKFTRDIPSAAWVGVSRQLSRLEWQHRRGRTARLPVASEVRSGERDLQGRCALVTGSAQRLGRSLAEHLAARGADVAIHYRASETAAREVVASLQARHPEQRFSAFRANLGVRSEVIGLAEAVSKTLGPIDLLVNNVGHYVPKNLLEVEYDEWDETMRVNLDGVFVLTRQVVDAAIARRAGWGRIVNLGHAGTSTVLARPVNSAYHVSKTALSILTRTFADLCGPYGITVNLLMPGILDNSIDLPHDVDAQIPLRRLGRAEDIVGGLAYLTSAAADYVTGAAIDICGGYGLAGSP